MKIVTVVGARPQFIKAAALSRVLRKEHTEILVHTGQHYDDNMSEIFFREMDIPAPDYHLGISGGSHGEMTGRMLVELEKVEDPAEQEEVKSVLERHAEYTGSPLAKRLLENWEDTLPRFTKVIPRDYKAMMQNISRFRAEGHGEEEARAMAFALGNK